MPLSCPYLQQCERRAEAIPSLSPSESTVGPSATEGRFAENLGRIAISVAVYLREEPRQRSWVLSCADSGPQNHPASRRVRANRVGGRDHRIRAGSPPKVSAARLPMLVDINEIADHLGVSVRHVRKLVAQRRIPYVKWGNLLRFDPNDIGVWLADKVVAPRIQVRRERRA